MPATKKTGKKLLIVESPAKAKTITKYLDGKYDVMASVGHVRDLPKSNKKAIDIEGGFVPHYEISKGKEAVVREIEKKAKKAEEVILATDPDREGEAIAWHIAEAIGLKKPKRVVFHEITKEAVASALTHPRHIDENLKIAQEARRVLDRLVGYDLSGLIWKKVRYGLSAGRVQSPALRILMEREREIRAFIPETYWVLGATLARKDGESFIFTCEDEPREHVEVERIKELAEKKSWTVTAIKETEVSRAPRPPFITSTLQQAASSRLGFSPSKTMGVAQKLYEAGLITYMRTDSTHLSTQALSQITNKIEADFGKEYVERRAFKTKSKNAQEAHEAIRPSSIAKQSAGTTDEQRRLYDLIWRRTVATQMRSAKMLRTKVTAGVLDDSFPPFSLHGSQVVFDGWLKVDPRAREEDTMLPKFTQREDLSLISLDVEEKETNPPTRYSEAGLVKELEKRGIGRPSTYASIIKTIVDRGYVEKVNKSLIPTDTGDVVSTFLEDNFADYISDTFTAEMEDKLDDLAVGKRKYVATLKEFYTPFKKEIKAKEKTDKITTLGKADDTILCPLCKSHMVIKLGKSGKFLSCEKFPDCMGARTIDGKEMEGPKDTGRPCPKCEKGTLVERDGRFGRFIACSTYPKCKYVEQDPEEEKKARTGVECPDCKVAGRKDGEMTERRGRFGIFYSCSNYPDCKTITKTKPTGKLCDVCGKLMMEGTKTIPERCSDKVCPNHRPDKLTKK